jgi:hypothetical protein
LSDEQPVGSQGLGRAHGSALGLGDPTSGLTFPDLASRPAISFTVRRSALESAIRTAASATGSSLP